MSNNKLEVALRVGSLSIIFLVVLLAFYAEIMPDAQSAGDDIADTGVPLGNLFSATSLIFVIVMAFLLILIVFAFLPKNGR